LFTSLAFLQRIGAAIEVLSV